MVDTWVIPSVTSLTEHSVCYNAIPFRLHCDCDFTICAGPKGRSLYTMAKRSVSYLCIQILCNLLQFIVAHDKGQIISKFIFLVSSISSKKRTKTRRIVVKCRLSDRK